MQPTLAEVKEIAQQAGVILRQGFGKPHQIRHKGVIDLVTEIDRRSEAFILGQIRGRFPGHVVVAEESGGLEGKDEHCWYIDPVDGTTNYAHGLPFFSVSIGVADKAGMLLGVVYDPMLDECFSAARGEGAWLNDVPIHVSETTALVDSVLATGFPGDAHTAEKNNVEEFRRFTLKVQSVRRMGSSALNLSYVAAGRLDGNWALGMHVWDLAAGALIVREAGGVITALDGDPEYMKPPYSLVAANPFIHPLMMEVLHNEG